MAIRALSLFLLLLLASPAPGQVSLSLREASARNPSTLLPRHEGSSMILRGTVTLKPILLGDYSQVPIRDSEGGRLMLEAPDFMFEHVAPGDELQVRGVITHRGGLPVLRMVELTTLNHTNPPPPYSRRIHQLQSISELGITAMIDGRVVALGEDSGGEYLLLDDGQPVPYPVYLSRAASRFGIGLGRYHVGDRVRVVGAASQANTQPPFEAKFRMIVPDAASVVLIDREWLVSPQVVLAAVLSFGSFLVLVLLRGRQRQAARRAIRRIHGLCEELLTISAFEDLVRKLRNPVPRALEVTSVELYRFDRQTQSLCGCVADPAPEPIPLSSPREDGHSLPSIALCFRNRTPLRIPGSSNSLLSRTNAGGVILLPMFAREELVGVLEIAHTDRPRRFSMEELVALQHLANQVAMVMKLLELQARKEQMMRGQRLAATGQIISGVAAELKEPLEAILILAHKLLDQGGEARAILNESLRASAILSRYSQIIRQDEGDAAPWNSTRFFTKSSIPAARISRTPKLPLPPLFGANLCGLSAPQGRSSMCSATSFSSPPAPLVPRSITACASNPPSSNGAPSLQSATAPSFVMKISRPFQTAKTSRSGSPFAAESYTRWAAMCASSTPVKMPAAWKSICPPRSTFHPRKTPLAKNLPTPHEPSPPSSSSPTSPPKGVWSLFGPAGATALFQSTPKPRLSNSSAASESTLSFVPSASREATGSISSTVCATRCRPSCSSPMAWIPMPPPSSLRGRAFFSANPWKQAKWTGYSNASNSASSLPPSRRPSQYGLIE